MCVHFILIVFWAWSFILNNVYYPSGIELNYSSMVSHFNPGENFYYLCSQRRHREKPHRQRNIEWMRYWDIQMDYLYSLISPSHPLISVLHPLLHKTFFSSCCSLFSHCFYSCHKAFSLIYELPIFFSVLYEFKKVDCTVQTLDLIFNASIRQTKDIVVILSIFLVLPRNTFLQWLNY